MTPERLKEIRRLAFWYELNPDMELDPETEEEILDYLDAYDCSPYYQEDTDVDNAYIDDLIDLRKMER